MKVYGAIFDNILLNFLRVFSLGVCYGIVETYVPGDQIPIYRVIYIIMFTFPFISKNLWLWLADSITCMTVQDAVYWIYIGKLPWQWSWYYPVYHHIPLLYFVSIPLAIYSYKRAIEISIYSRKNILMS